MQDILDSGVKQVFFNATRFPDARPSCMSKYHFEGAFAEKEKTGMPFQFCWLQVVLIGSDCPDMDGSVLKQAFAALESHDVS